MPPTVLPIFLLPPTPTTPGSMPPFVSTVASAVGTWLKDHARPTSGDAQITFGLEVFAGGGVDQKPLLTVANVHIDVADLATS
jgi:hypothetical protein